MFYIFFFFQAEDGIRDRSPSRGLGDVYKRQALKIGLLRVEECDFEKGEFVITVHEDLDCSGLPATGELVCRYDEGFLAGILEMYTGKRFQVREVECWASGSRVCRFKGNTDDDQS